MFMLNKISESESESDKVRRLIATPLPTRGHAF